jgi:HAD superfamily hydrolase (TIGR01459 family)
MTQIIENLSDVSAQYDVVFCDLWGCLHNGREVFPAAVKALQAYRAQGGIVALVTNAPRPAHSVAAQLERLGAPRDCYDVIATSGDSAQTAMAAGLFGRKVYHLGPADKDAHFFVHADGSPVDVERVPLGEAEGIVCTGLVDDTKETPDDYRAIILEGVNRGLPLLCANPDIVVDFGETRRFCAGALALAYTEAGGQSHYFGKPHPPIYALTRTLVTSHSGRAIDDDRILCIGDGLPTDVKGALGENLDCLFISGGLAAEETGTVDGVPNLQRTNDTLGRALVSARFTIGHLR